MYIHTQQRNACSLLTHMVAAGDIRLPTKGNSNSHGARPVY